MRITGPSVVAAALLFCAPVVGQEWRGPLGLEVRVEDAKGRNIERAEVLLTYLAPEGGALPSVLTDGKGEAALGGLAAGRWNLEVRHAGHMTYRAEIVLSDSAKPQILSASQLMTPGATSTLKVKLARGRGGVPPPARQVATAPVAAALAPIPSAPRPAQPPSQPATPTNTVPSAAAPAAAPTPAVSRPPAPVPAQAPPSAPPAESTEPPAAPPPSARTPAVPVPAPDTAPPQPALERPSAQQPGTPPHVPASAPVPELRAAPAPAPPVEVAVPPAQVAAPVEPPAPPRASLPPSRQHLCVECPAGESASWAEGTVPLGDPGGCPDDLRARLESVALDAVDALASTLGPGCRLLAVELPAGARFTGFRYEAQSAQITADCLPGRDCPAGECQFPWPPIVRRERQRTVLLTAFVSRSGDPRRAVVAGYSTFEKKR